MREIVFTKTFDVSDEFAPKPASAFIPEWYKKLDSYYGDGKTAVNGSTTQTIKKCMPVFDAITAGYIIPTPCDVYISEQDDKPYYSWRSQNLGFHPVEQAPNHPNANGFPFPKWINPWGIKTPKGYSVMIVPPMHRDNKYFSIMPGIVDTDVYSAEVNFPFTLNEGVMDDVIPAGTPMAQVIPFRRESWKAKMGADKERTEIGNVRVELQARFFNSYKKIFWTKKEFR